MDDNVEFIEIVEDFGYTDETFGELTDGRGED